MTEQRRWPTWVYGTGEEPDYRFSFANERTFLSWIRTALALFAGGVALDALPLSIPHVVQVGLSLAFVVLGLTCALAAWWRWARAERAMRRAEALPASQLGLALSLAVTGSALLVLAVLVLRS
ncbi:MAG: DUF202 domain-containing protein [Nostocoides sp.]